MSSAFLYHLRHPLTWQPSANPSSERNKAPLCLPHSFSLWLPSLIGGVATSTALYLSGKRDYRLLLGASFLAVTALFYLTTALIKSYIGRVIPQAIRSEIGHFFEQQATALIPQAYLYSNISHNPNEWKKAHEAKDELSEETFCALVGQNALAWQWGYTAEKKDESSQDDSGPCVIHPSSFIPHDLRLTNPGLELHSKLGPHTTNLLTAVADPISIFKGLQVESGPTIKPLILALCPNGKVSSPHLMLRTPLSHAIFSCLSGKSTLPDHGALYIHTVPVIRASRSDGFSFIEEPDTPPVMAVYHKTGYQKEAIWDALRRALKTDPETGKKVAWGEGYSHLIIPVRSIDEAPIWWSMFGNQEDIEFCGHFETITFTFEIKEMESAFFRNYQKPQTSQPASQAPIQPQSFVEWCQKKLTELLQQGEQ